MINNLFSHRLPRLRQVGRRAPPDFGIFFDIDGVIVRGKNVLPFAPHAFKRLVDDNGNFKVPTVFVTNACNTLRKNKVSKSLKQLVVFVKPFVLLVLFCYLSVAYTP